MAKPVPTTIPDDVKARFWAKVDVRGSDDCWLWTGAHYDGYGTFSLCGRAMRSMRAAQFIVGARPADGQHVDHICRNRACVNPAHLRNVAPRDNTLAEGSLAISAINFRKTHCKSGHELTPENTYRVGPNRAWRMCKRCAYLADMARQPRPPKRRKKALKENPNAGDEQ